MPSVIQPADFFVVGGPVSAERSCYVERAADRRLAEALRARRLCCVLGARATGKSSLLERAARAERAAGSLVANIGLRPIVERLGDDDADGLLRVAEHIAAALALDVDVAGWWRERGTLADSKLAEFFWQLVLTNTTAPVVVLIDDVDAALESPFIDALLDGIGACYERRSGEPDFARLTFVVAGAASQAELADDDPAHAFAEAESIEPEDFSAEQAYRLAVAFGGDRELSQALMDRIRAWTGGYPYLTQRVARGVARRGGRLEDVERAIHEHLLAPGAADKDPLLAHVHAWLAEPSRPARRATELLRRVAAGRKVAQPADAEVWEKLWLSGTVRVEGERELRVRNRIVKELVAAGWLKHKPSAWRWAAVAAALLAVLAGGAYWYTQRLPVADIETLTSAAAAPNAAEAAYRRLRALPGFAERADELWLDALGRHSRAATTLAEAAAADTRLRELPGQDAAADQLLSDFWLRRAREQAHAEQREAALLLAQRAASLPAAAPAAAAYLAELAGSDYRLLERTLRMANAPEYWHMGFEREAVVHIGPDRQASRTPLGVAAGRGTVASAPFALTALEHAALTRALAVEGEGTAGEFELSLIVQHAAAGELLVTLTAPSGAQAAVTVPRTDGENVETFTFQAVPGSSLAQLADDGVSGTWRLTIVDRVGGNTGVFGGWGLTFDASFGRDDPPQLLAIPDPRRIDAVNVLAVADRAVAWPTSPAAIGTVALWNLTTGQLEQDFTLPAAPQQVALAAGGARVLAATDSELRLWNAADGALVARVATQTEFVLPPVFSADGGYVAIAERVEGANPLYSVLRSADGSLVGTIDGAADAEGWELGPGGRYVALQGPDTVVRVIETRRGVELGRLAHTESVERLLHSADGASLLTIDRRGAIAAWPLTASPAPRPRTLGRTAGAASASLSGDGRRLAYARDDGAVAVVDVGAAVELERLRLSRAASVTATQLSADGTELVTQTGSLLKLWRLPAAQALPAAEAPDVAPAVVALDRTSELLGVGLASGQLLLELSAAAASSGSTLAYIGHRGPVTAVALNGARGLAATGGSDGIVRVWDVASGAPTVALMQPVEAPIERVAVSADGRYVASVAGRTVRVGSAVDGRLVAELPADGAVSALAFAPDGDTIAVAAATGAVVIAETATARARATARLDAAATSLAFSPDGRRLALGDARGAISLLDAATADSAGSARPSSQPIDWLELSADGGALLVATDAWLHSLAVPALTVVESKLVAWPAASVVRSSVSPTAVGFAGIAIDGSLRSGVIDLAAPVAGASDASVLVERDWSAAFALRLNDNGEVVQFDP